MKRIIDQLEMTEPEDLLPEDQYLLKLILKTWQNHPLMTERHGVLTLKQRLL